MQTHVKQPVLEAKFGLPAAVRFCKRCVISNQRPCSSPEHKHHKGEKKLTTHIDDEGICDACRFADEKEKTDWKKREKLLLKLLDKHRSKDGSFDCIVPGSGGKDSCFTAHILKYKYGMNPLTVTWPPLLYTAIGWKNFRNWLDVGGFHNITFNYNGRVHALLTKLAIEHLMFPFQPFVFGQKNLAPKIAVREKIPLIFYGECGVEYGNPLMESKTSLMDKAHYAKKNLKHIYLGGVTVRELFEKHGLTMNDIEPYLPVREDRLKSVDVEVHHLSYYLKWVPQEVYYYAVEHCGFEANPVRTEGTYSKYNSLDDCVDGFHFYSTYIKFGLGRVSHEASQEIRNKHITREEAIMLLKRFEGEFPKKYFHKVMDYIGMAPERFMELCDEFRSPHLWERRRGEWKLRYPVWEVQP